MMINDGKRFERYELKYILTKKEFEYVRGEICKEMHIDQYGLSTVQSIYFDTPTKYLIRTSLEKPTFKEKIRLRGYGLLKENDPCFLELKRKYKGLVYKRRIEVTENQVKEFLENKQSVGNEQIARELDYFRDYYQNLEPHILIIYERESYYKEGWDGRVTFDIKPRYRVNDLNLHTSLDGTPIMDDDLYILEIKVHQNIPLWLSNILSRGNITRRSFSKYGEAYMLEKIKTI